MLQLGGVGGLRSKTRVWFKAVKVAALDYQRKILEDFLPVLVHDFSKSVVVKFSRGKLTDEDISNLKRFMDMVEKSNFKKLEIELLRKVEGLKIKAWNNKMNDEKLDIIKRSVAEGHHRIFKRLELHVRSKVSDEVYNRSVKRSNIQVMLYNFMDGKEDECLKNLFQHGMDPVPSSRMSKKRNIHHSAGCSVGVCDEAWEEENLWIFSISS